MGCSSTPTIEKENDNINNNNKSIILPKICLGAWAWGNDGTFGNQLTPNSLRPIFESAMK